ncbi:hypothetical protein [Candidatus Protofrankia datiscae]|uniref:hypothetical protein n=1 Tax=Candidatus Protofrankia datiscae TaxID=2716812 RepID=UPI0002E8E525|nr:hypothetical protein [Candidatus Protofrankia datiscae]
MRTDANRPRIPIPATEIAEELVARLDVVPEWRPNLPVLRPEPEPAHRADVPRL